MANPKYEVGYGKPPKHSQFRPGQSGNLKGRPKGSANFTTDVQTVLKQRIPVREGGKAKRVSTQHAVILATVQKALQGDIRAIALFAGWAMQLQREVSEGQERSNSLSPEDKAIMDQLLGLNQSKSTKPTTAVRHRTRPKKKA